MMATAVRFFTLPYGPRNPSFVLNNTLPSSSFGSLTISSHNLFSKGCLSMSITLRPIRQSVVCMSSRYGAGSRKRKLKSRKRGGNPDKKRKRTRSSLGKRKQKFRIVKLASEAGTGYVYVRKVGKNATKSFQNKKNDPSTKLELMKYDPKAKRHVLFKERK